MELHRRYKYLHSIENLFAEIKHGRFRAEPSDGGIHPRMIRIHVEFQ